ncbi:MAG: YlxM family DNA-binding protein [Clostridia bacterium]|nr:YlxM family DNA-binding protein [Clostridia bacterium]
MFEKNLTIGYLLDFYGELLSDRRRELMSLYYNEDYSLAEIADEVGISRQGVRDAIKRGEEELCNLEEKLGLAARFAELQALSDRLEAILASPDANGISPALRETLADLCERLK